MADLELNGEGTGSQPKKLKLTADENVLAAPAGPTALETFESFNIKNILRDSPESRLVAVEGTICKNKDDGTDGDAAVVILEKTHFTEADVKGILSGNTKLNCLFNNDIYYNLLCCPPVELNSIKATVICPATEKHIEKYKTKTSHLIEETPSIYQHVTLPYIENSKFDIQVLT